LETKYCPRCGETKEVSEFYFSRARSDGLHNWCKKCMSAATADWKRRNRKKYCATKQRHQSNLKAEVLTHYGAGEYSCVRCGFTDIHALSIDHINGDGAQHRKSLGMGSGSGFYQWLKNQGYPEGYQTLCMNCQFIKKGEQETRG